ncbi:MAG: hypothetical protein WDZ76_03390 [Pseudohongiellaceae bacterium]
MITSRYAPHLFTLLATVASGIVSGTAYSADAFAVDFRQTPSGPNNHIESIELVDGLRGQIAELELEHGSFDLVLLEPLQSLTQALIEIGEFGSADTLLNRRLQLLRSESGLSNPEQIPIIEEIIKNSMRLGNWKTVQRQYEHILWLRKQDANADVNQVLEAMDDVAHWNMAMVSLDHPRNRTQNFLDARELQRDIVRVAEKEFGDNSFALVPWLYKQALNQHRLLAFLASDDELSYDAREDILMKEALSGADYLRSGLHIIYRIEEIAGRMNDLEAEAMARIYAADFQFLLNLGTSIAVYGEAVELLEQAGVSQDRIRTFFDRPVILPVDQFFFRLDDAIAHQQRRDDILDQLTGDADNWEGVNLGGFVAWNESLRFAQQPPLPSLAEGVIDMNLNVVEARFSVSAKGFSTIPDILASDPDNIRARTDARDAIASLPFRPPIVDGRPRRSEEILLRFAYPPPL